MSKTVTTTIINVADKSCGPDQEKRNVNITEIAFNKNPLYK